LSQRLGLSWQLVSVLSFIILLLSAFCSQALAPQTTRNVINGNAPYLTFDGGITRTTDTEGLLGLTLPDIGTITPSSNPSSLSNPIQLQRDNVRFSDIGMFVPADANSIALNTLIGSPNHYWGDDDGDGDIFVTGDLHLSIIDKDKQAVMRNEVFDICKSPYTITLSTTAGKLSTRYGFPNSSDLSPRSAIYYIKPKDAPKVCFARPNLSNGSDEYAGPPSIWNEGKGFLPQSTDSSHYDLNFPTTGANKLYFYLDIGGVDPSTLSWPSVTEGGITASMEVVPPNPSADIHHAFERLGGLRVTLTGPVATSAQWNSDSPGMLQSIPSLPATFKLVGRDNSGREIITYGFKLKQWFVNRGNYQSNYANQASWCRSIGYQVSSIRDLTNAVRKNSPRISGAMPFSFSNNYQRNIDAGFFTEWGYMDVYKGSQFTSDGYWTSDASNGIQFDVDSYDGDINWNDPSRAIPNTVCALVPRP
jgi:hypothetical protein